MHVTVVFLLRVMVRGVCASLDVASRFAVGQVNTEVIKVVHIQYTAIGGRVVVEC